MQGALDARAKLASPARQEDEERDEKRLSKADWTARATSSATFSTASVISGRCARDPQRRRGIEAESIEIRSPRPARARRRWVPTRVEFPRNHHSLAPCQGPTPMRLIGSK